MPENQEILEIKKLKSVAQQYPNDYALGDYMKNKFSGPRSEVIDYVITVIPNYHSLGEAVRAIVTA